MIKLKRFTAYTVQEVAEALDLTPATIRRYIKSGTIKAQKVGSKWYITDANLEYVFSGDTDNAPDEATTASSVVSETTDGER